MKLIFETCQPRADVLSGELREEMFAAHLRDVIDETADPIYSDPEVFFEHSYPTDGMVSLLREALGRLSGVKSSNAPIIRLETSFGGGKTHNLIGLYHAARTASSDGIVLSRFVDADLLPSAPVDKIAGVVGSDLDPVNGLDHGDATTYTVWGEIAYQIGGARGYELIRKSDEALVAPGVQVFEKLIGDSPALIMLDELAAFLRKADGVVVGNTTLAEQSTTFLLSLLSFAAKMHRVVVVITLADSKDAFASETDRVQAALIEAGKISARQEAIITPTNEREIAPIVVHRLFQSVDREAALEVGEAYRDYYEEQISKGVELPEQAIRAEYRDEIATNYPFSPELITTLNRKTSTIPDFQRTRGALRLLASVIRRLWGKKPQDSWLIHSHHIDLGTESILNELTSRLKRPQYRQVVEADIASALQGSTAHATEVDRPLVAAGRPPYARRFGTTAFLHSIVQGVASGVEPSEALLAVLTPSEDPGHVQKAMYGLLDRAWFLDYDGRRYRFKTEPSLNKLVADEMEIVGRLKPKEELNRRIRNVWRKGVFRPVYFPTEAAEVDDDAKEPKLVVVHYDAATASVENQKPPDLVAKIFDHAGTLQGYRTYRNNVLFLLADTDQVERIVEVARRHYAINRIITDDDRMSEFSEEQRKKLRRMLEEAELQYRVAITKAYRFLFYPSADAAEEFSRLARETLPAQDQGNVEQDQTQVVLRVLRQLDKVLTGEDKPLPSAYVKAKAWPYGKNYSTTSELSRAFAQRLGLRILLDPSQLKKTIRDGCKLGTWVYQAPGESRVYGPPSPVPMVEISEDALLYTPEEAEKIGLPVIGEEKPTCPLCGNPADQCVCDKVCPKCGQDPCACVKPRKALRGDGAPAQAFQQVLDGAADQKITRIKRVMVKVEGTGKEAANDTRLMGLAIPQLGAGTFAIEQSIDCEFGPEEKYQGVFRGSWDRYKQVKTLTDTFGKVAEKVRVNMQLRADFEAGLDVSGDQFQTIREVFGTLGFGRLQVVAEAADEEDK